MTTMTVHDVQQGTPAAKPELTADEFAASLPKWKKLIDDRKQTAGQIITMASTRNTLTEDHGGAAWKDTQNSRPGVSPGCKKFSASAGESPE